jgi:hypothetical protein
MYALITVAAFAPLIVITLWVVFVPLKRGTDN